MLQTFGVCPNPKCRGKKCKILKDRIFVNMCRITDIKTTTEMMEYLFYDNCRNSWALIGWFSLSTCRQTHGFIIYAMCQPARADNLTICHHKKQTDLSFLVVFPIIDYEFRHNIVKVVCGSTWLSPCGSTTTLTMLWRNSWSIMGQTHEELTSIC